MYLKAIFLLFVSLVFVINSLMAAQVSALYDVEVLVKDEGADQRWGAFVKGLDEVFVRIAGDSIVMDKLKRPAPTAYVKRYSYEPVEPPVEGEKGELLTHRIKIQYNGSLMEKYLQGQGFAVWGEHRPQVIIWLAVRDGRNEYVLKASDSSLLKQITDEAMTRRGIPERWPLYDSKDRKVLSITDIRGGFQDQVNAASKRYTRGPALTGSMMWNGRQWQSNWSLLMASGDRHWNLSDADYEQLLNKAIDTAADTLGGVFAVHGDMSSKSYTAIHLDIAAVTSVEKYRHVEEYLKDLSVVANVSPVNVDASSVVFKVMLRSSEEDFLNLIKNDAELVRVEVVSPEEPEPMDIESLDIEPPGETASSQVDGGETDESNAEELNATESPDTPVSKPVPVYYYRLIK